MDDPPGYPLHHQHEQLLEVRRHGSLGPSVSSGGGRPLSQAGSPGDTGTDADTATVVLVARRALQPIPGRKEVLKLAFSPNGEWIVGLAEPKLESRPSAYGERASKSLFAWRAYRPEGVAKPDDFARTKNNHIFEASDFAFAPPHAGSAAISVACPALSSTDDCMAPRLDIHHVTPGPPSPSISRAVELPLPVSGPIAWSPDGTLIAAASTSNPSRVVLLAVSKSSAPRQLRVLPNFGGRITHLAFVACEYASGASSGFALASAALDGVVRITDLETAQTLRKFEIAVAASPHHHDGASLFRASADGRIVASVWGRDVMLWYPESGEARVYSLNAARLTEGWPLDISPDCRYMACRTEVGLDVSDLATGRFLGEARVDDCSFFSVASFAWDNSLMAVGKHTGEVYVYEVIVVNCAV